MPIKRNIQFSLIRKFQTMPNIKIKTLFSLTYYKKIYIQKHNIFIMYSQI